MASDDAQAFLHRYTRREAISDGFLIDVTRQAQAAGLPLPTAVTIAAWEETIDPPTDYRDPASDESDDVALLATLLAAAAEAVNGDSATRTAFQAPSARGAVTVELLVALTMEGDNGQPVLTIMRSDED